MHTVSIADAWHEWRDLKVTHKNADQRLHMFCERLTEGLGSGEYVKEPSTWIVASANVPQHMTLKLHAALAKSVEPLRSDAGSQPLAWKQAM